MDFRSMLDQVKSAFVIGKNNPFLHGRQSSRGEEQGYQEVPAYQAPQQVYAQGNPGYQPPYQQAAAPTSRRGLCAPRGSPIHSSNPTPRRSRPAVVAAGASPTGLRRRGSLPPSTIQPVLPPGGGRNRRPAAPERSAAGAAAPSLPPPAGGNVVPFGASDGERGVDAALSTYSTSAPAAGMSCLRKGMHAIRDGSAVAGRDRRYVDMLTGVATRSTAR